MKPSVTIAPKTNKSFPLKKVLCGIGLLILVLAGLLAYHVHDNKVASEKAFQADKARFALIEKDMQLAYRNIKLSVGEPYEGKLNERGCGYTSQKFAKGDLICNVQYTFAYGANETTELETKLKDVENSFVTTKQRGLFLKDDSQTAQAPQLTTYSNKLYLEADHQSSCDISYSLQSPQSLASYDVNGVENSNILVMQLRCSSGVKVPIYTLAE